MYVFKIRKDRNGYYWEFAAEGGRGTITRSTSNHDIEVIRHAVSILQMNARNTQIDDPYPS